MRKSERKIKELACAADKDKKNHKRMQALIDQMQRMVKSYKKQIEEAEEIAALILAKYLQAQRCLGSVKERAQATLAKNRLRVRNQSIGPGRSQPWYQH